MFHTSSSIVGRVADPPITESGLSPQRDGLQLGQLQDIHSSSLSNFQLIQIFEQALKYFKLHLKLIP